MLNEFFSSILSVESASVFSLSSFLWCTVCSLVLGAVIALFYAYKTRYSTGFLVTLALMPAIVQLVIMLVNGNLGTGVAVMGAFSLVRFRSVPGTAKEICSLFLAMAIGLATGMGYLGIAVLFALIICLVNLVYTVLASKKERDEKLLKITIPESLDYSGVFDDLFESYTDKAELLQVKTSNLGSLFKLKYLIVLKENSQEKAFLDEIRVRNGNLEIECSRNAAAAETL